MKFLSKLGLMLLVLASYSMILSTAQAANAQAEKIDTKALKAKLMQHVPQASEAIITATPIKGLYQVISGSEVMYMSKDGRYFLDGSLLDMQTRTNLTDNARGTVRLKALDALGEDNMLVYMPKGKVKHTITVFTDIYCPYCRKLHNEMDDYLDNGVKVRYIFVPFKGEKSVNTSVSVWCADNRNDAMDMAKSGNSIESKTCDNPISKHQALAAKLSIRGTPAIMLDSGQLLPGYVPSAKVLERLNTTL